MPSARFNLWNKSNKDKETLIFLIYRYNDRRLKISSGETVPPKYWNFSEQKVKELRAYPKHIYINERLSDLKNAVEKAHREFIREGIDPSPDELKSEYLLQLSGKLPKKKRNFWEEFDNFLEAEKGRVVDSVIKDYHSLKKHLKGFENYFLENISFSSFNYAFYQRFVHYLTYEVIKPDNKKGLATNTVGKQIKNLKIFLNFCFKNEIVDRFDLSDYKTLTEEVDKIYNEYPQI